MQPTLEDVAGRAGVSRGTASRALTGHPNVAAATRQRVLAAAAALGYRPDRAARALAGGSGDRVAVLSLVHPWSPTADPFLASVVAGGGGGGRRHRPRGGAAPAARRRPGGPGRAGRRPSAGRPAPGQPDPGGAGRAAAGHAGPDRHPRPGPPGRRLGGHGQRRRRDRGAAAPAGRRPAPDPGDGRSVVDALLGRADGRVPAADDRGRPPGPGHPVGPAAGAGGGRVRRRDRRLRHPAGRRPRHP